MHNPLKFTDPSGYYPKELGNHPTPVFSGYNLDQLILSEGGFGGGVLTYEVMYGNWDAYTAINAGLMIGAGVAKKYFFGFIEYLILTDHLK